ncbi:MAG: RHS repeat-associated core domain-containing protein [Acidimicrobiia bacterium]
MVDVEFNVRSLWLFPVYFGSVRVTDQQAGVDVTVPIWFGQVTPDGANGATSTYSFFGLVNLDWSVTDNGAGNDEVSLSLSGAVDYEAYGTITDGDLQVTKIGETVTGVTGSASLVGGSHTTDVAYSYDADGNRLAATTETGTTYSLWDRNAPVPQLVGESDGGGVPLRDYVFGESTISMRAAGGESFFHRNDLGNIAAVTSADGTPRCSYDYEPFGAARRSEQLEPSAPANPMRFTGEYLDEETGLYNLRARQYDPSTGRFLATDPLQPSADSPSVSSYAYVRNRPGVLVDPMGLRGCGWRDLGNCLDDAVDWVGENRVGITKAVDTGGVLLGTGVTFANPPAGLALVAGGSALNVTSEALDEKPCKRQRVARAAALPVFWRSCGWALGCGRSLASSSDFGSGCHRRRRVCRCSVPRVGQVAVVKRERYDEKEYRWASAHPRLAGSIVGAFGFVYSMLQFDFNYPLVCVGFGIGAGLFTWWLVRPGGVGHRWRRRYEERRRRD